VFPLVGGLGDGPEGDPPCQAARGEDFAMAIQDSAAFWSFGDQADAVFFGEGTIAIALQHLQVPHATAQHSQQKHHRQTKEDNRFATAPHSATIVVGGQR
jgi:hypothetical protein